MRLRLSTICRKSQNKNYLRIRYLFSSLKWNKFMFAFTYMPQDIYLQNRLRKIFDSANVLSVKELYSARKKGCAVRVILKLIPEIR